ncbi:MAG: AI-2E family transporter [Bdellovibrionales bacterium]
MNQFFESHRQAVLLILMASLVIPFAWVLQPFWITIILALVFSVTLEPLHAWLEDRFKGRSNWALFVLLTGVTLLFLIPFTLVLIKGVSILSVQIRRLGEPESMDRLKTIQESLMARLQVLNEYGIDPSTFHDQAWATAQRAGSFLTAMLGNTVSQIPEMLLLLFVLILCMVSFLSMKHSAQKAISEIGWVTPEGRDKFITKFKNCCKSVMVSTFVTGFAQALLTTLGALIFTRYDLLLVFFITFLLAFIPVIGAGPVSFILSLVSFFEGDLVSGVGLLVVSGLTGVLDNVLRPLLVAGNTKIPGIWALFCTIGAIMLIGLAGLFIGPLIGSLTVDLLPVLANEYKRKGETATSTT